jgi:hypothetical protein
LRNEAEADDLVQEVFLFIFRKAALFDSSHWAARSWIIHVTYHRAFDRRRYLNSRHFYSCQELDDTAFRLADLREELPFHERSMEGILGKPLMARFAARPTPEQQETIRLYFFEGVRSQRNCPTYRAAPLQRQKLLLSRVGTDAQIRFRRQVAVKMSEMGHNGSSHGVWTMQGDPHQEFQELCALSTTGELTAEEWARLTEHLADCAVCREAKRQYEGLIATMIPALGAESTADEDGEDAPGVWSLEEAEATLMASLRDEPVPSVSRPIPVARPSRWSKARRYAVAALILAACSLAGYRIGAHQATRPNAAIKEKDRQIVEERELLDRDRDIRNLIGARNLYIAEIYDISQSGDTQKPFGRVFYTKDKSLIFYGYDLDQQPGVKKAAAFQAWGGRGADRQHAVSLGLLYRDDANQKRWILKSNDAKTISQIDAVFVTVEPEGGSAKPSGKPLLFTYLRLDPNHP